MDLNFNEMKSIKIYSALAILILTVACIPEPLPVDGIPQLKSKIVVATQIVPDQTVAILLTKSVGALDANRDSDIQELLAQVAINDALVIIYNDTFRDTLDFIQLGLYTSTSIPLTPGVEYSLLVNSPTMGEVTATTKVLSQAVFNSVEARIFDTGFDTLATVNYSFQDEPGPNWYMFNVQRITEDFESDDLLNPSIFTHLETDVDFENELRENELKVFLRRDFIPGDTLAMFLSNISKEYYAFNQIRLDSRFNFADFLGEPANYPTNIKGGLGFFNLHIPDVRLLVLKE
jgi:hypothetical protein